MRENLRRCRSDILRDTVDSNESGNNNFAQARDITTGAKAGSMMPRPRPTDNGSSINTNNNTGNTESSINDSSNGMNVNLNSNVNYNARGSSNSAAASNRAGVGDQIRQRYGHHGPGGDAGSTGASAGGGGAPAFGGAVGGQAAAAAAAMGDYSGLANQYGRAAAAGLAPSTLGPFNPGSSGAMNAAMNPSSLYPHLGAATAAGIVHQSPQQAAALGDQLDFRSGGGSAVPGNPSSVSQAEQEEELLLNILIARRQRQICPPGGGGPAHSTSWADDFVRLREKTMSQQQEHMGASASGERTSFDGLPNALQQGDGSHRSHSTGRMNIGAGMGHMQNPNMNNMNMPAQRQQFLSDPSRLRHRGGGSGVGFQIGPSQGAWMGTNAASMQSHPNTPRNDNAYAHGQRQDSNMKSNTQLGMEVLERVDRMIPANMMHDARMADQGGAGQHHYHNHFSVGQHPGIMLQDSAAMGYGKRSLEGQGLQAMDKRGKHQQQQMQQLFASPQKPHPAEEAQPTRKKRLHKRKPADMPRRPLSAYNLFFSEERERILKEIEGKSEDGETSGTSEDKNTEAPGSQEAKDEGKPKALLRPLLPSEKKRRPHRKTHGKISFQLLAQKVGQRWKALPDDRRKYYQDLAQEDMKRQKKAMEEYYQKRSVLSANDTKE